MHSVSDIIKGFSKDIGIKESRYLTLLRKKWALLVGDAIATHTYASYIKGQTLHLKVDSPQWVHNLSFFKRELLEKLHEFDITDLRMSIGKIPCSTKVTQSSDVTQLTEEDRDFIQKTTSCLKEREIREAFEALMKKSLSHNKQYQSPPLKKED